MAAQFRIQNQSHCPERIATFRHQEIRNDIFGVTLNSQVGEGSKFPFKKDHGHWKLETGKL